MSSGPPLGVPPLTIEILAAKTAPVCSSESQAFHVRARGPGNVVVGCVDRVNSSRSDLRYLDPGEAAALGRALLQAASLASAMDALEAAKEQVYP